MNKRVVVIGAGPAGLTAAYELVKTKKFEVIVLEESNDVGGISKTINYKGNRMDIGGHRFFSKSDRVTKWWESFMGVQGAPSYDDLVLKKEKKMVDKGPNPEVEDEVFLNRDRISRIYYKNKFFDYPVSLKYNTIKNMGFFETILVGFSYLKSLIFKKKEYSLEDFYINRFGKKLYSMFFENYTEKLWGRHPSKISPDWGAQRVKGLSIFAMIKDVFKKIFHIKNKNVETSLIESSIYPKYGPGQFWELISKQIVDNGGKILFGYKATKIQKKNNKIKSIICDNGEEIKGDIFLSSMPLKDLILSIDDKKEKRIEKIALNLPYRDFVTVGVLLKKINLKNETKIKTLNNIIPDCWLYVQDCNVKLGRIQVFNNWSPYLVKDYNKLWLGLEYFCNEGDTFWNLKDKEYKKFVADELIKMNLISEQKDILDYHVEKVKKAYPAYFDSYKNIDVLKNYINKIDNLLCIGRNGQHRYNNMDHSMLTAFYAVDYLNNKVKNKEGIWSINAEKEFHESK